MPLVVGRPSSRPSTLSATGTATAPSTASAALHALLDDQVAAVQAADGRVRTGGRSGIHRMRVALRRLRSTLTTFRPFLDDSVDGLRHELRWFASELGPARDAEVLRARLSAACAEDPGLGSDALAVLDRFLSAGERDAQVRAENAWGSQRHGDLSAALVRLFASDLVTLDPHVGALDAFVPLVRDEVRRVRRRAERVGDPDDGSRDTDRDELVHDLRKATKRARYTSEVLLPFDRRPAAKLGRRLERLQVLLGDRQDSAVAREYLQGLLDTGDLNGHGTQVVERLLERERATTVRLDEKLPHRVEKATRPLRLLSR